MRAAAWRSRRPTGVPGIPAGTHVTACHFPVEAGEALASARTAAIAAEGAAHEHQSELQFQAQLAVEEPQPGASRSRAAASGS